MNKKNEANWGPLGSGFGHEVPADVNDFFGSEAPATEPAIQWTAEQERAAQEARAREAEARAREAEAKAAAEQAAAEQAAEKARLAAEAQERAKRERAADSRVAAARGSESAAPRGSSSGPSTPAERQAADKGSKEPKTFGQTIRSHWDSLIDSLGIGGKSKTERARSVPESSVEDESEESSHSVPASPPPASSSPPRSGRRAEPRATAEAVPPKAAPRERSVTSRPNAGEPMAAVPSPAGAVPSERRSSRATKPSAASVPPVETPPQAAAEIPADAFGFGIFDPPSTAHPNPLDSLFAEQTSADPELDSPEADESFAERRPRGSRRRGTGRRAAGDPLVSDEMASEERSTDRGIPASRGAAPRNNPARNLPSTASNLPPESEPVPDDEIEFEVVDLAGDDISDLWDRPRRVSRSAPVLDDEATDPTPRHRGRPRPEVAKQPAPPARSRPEPGTSRPAALRPPIVQPLEDDGEEIGSSRRRPRSARPKMSAPPESPPPAVREGSAREIGSREAGSREGSQGRRRPAAERPAPARVSRPRPVDDDDDGYTVDNSWSPDDVPDPDAPRRRPVPAWRKVIDHIVDLNLSNRRGADGGRRRSGNSPRSGGPSAGRRPDATADRPRGARRSTPPTYLDDPNPAEAFDHYGDDDWDAPIPEPQPPRGGGSRGRRTPRPDDFPPSEDRPSGRGRRRY